MKRPFRKPLIVFTPKKLLRYNRAVSKIEDLSKGCFKEVIDDVLAKPKAIDTVVLCSGKFYYDLIEKYETLSASNIAFVRLEQLYPFPKTQLSEIVKKYGDDCNYIWAQEEPENMGAWSFVLQNLGKIIPIKLVSRRLSAAPASGSSKKFNKRQELILNKIFN